MTTKTNDKIRKIAGVRFRENWKVYDFEAGDLELAVNDKVIVDSDRGMGLAQVVRIKKLEEIAAESPPTDLPAAEQAQTDPGQGDGKGDGETTDSSREGAPTAEPESASLERAAGKNGGGNGSSEKNCPPRSLRKIVRKASEEDLVREKKNRERETEAFGISQDLIAEKELPMKLIRVEYSLDASRATFFFFSETRIDFRDLVKDLAFKLRSRIEMRQIGVRDVARMIGGFGPCGRELCCASFLKNFEPVSIRMAKKQEMVLNPAKISGVCGRLLCCLSYEFEMYDDIKKDVVAMREAAQLRDKKENEERRIAAEQEEQERRQADRKRQEERKAAPERREKKRDETPRPQRGERQRPADQEKRGEQEKKKTPPQDKQPQQKTRQQKPEGQEAKQRKTEQPKQQPKQQPHRVPQVKTGPLPDESQPIEPQSGAEQPADGDKAARKNKRRFWRKKKKGGASGDARPPLGGGSGQGGGSEGARV